MAKGNQGAGRGREKKLRKRLEKAEAAHLRAEQQLEARQALLAKLGARESFWLCHDCAENDASVAELVAAYRRARAGGG